MVRYYGYNFEIQMNYSPVAKCYARRAALGTLLIIMGEKHKRN